MIFRERLIRLAEEIAALRAALRAKEEELDQLLPNGDLPPFKTANPVDGSIDCEGQSSVSFAGATLIEQVLRYFAAHRTEAIGPHALRALLELPTTQEKSLRATMGRLAADGKIRRVTRGRYAANIEEPKGNDPNPSG
jgi:hypothetical protein